MRSTKTVSYKIQRNIFSIGSKEIWQTDNWSLVLILLPLVSMKNMKKFTITFLLFLLPTLTASVFGQTDVISYSQPQIDNMVDDAISKIVESISQTDPSIKMIAIWNLETGQNNVDINLIEQKLTIGLIRVGSYRRFDVIDRPALEIQAEEHDLTLSRVFDRRKMMEVGKIIGIHGFIYGSIALVDDKLVFNLKLVNTDTGSFAWADEIKGEDLALIERLQQEQIETQQALERQTALKRLKSGTKATLESLALPGLGQFYIEESSRAVTYLFIEAISWGVVIQAALADDNSADTRKFIGIGMIGLNHFVSALDAVIFTERHNRRIKDQYNISFMAYPRKQVMFTCRF